MSTKKKSLFAKKHKIKKKLVDFIYYNICIGTSPNFQKYGHKLERYGHIIVNDLPVDVLIKGNHTPFWVYTEEKIGKEYIHVNP